MKSVYIILTLCLVLVSCEKDCYDCPECIIGEWQWVKSCGGFTGGCWYPSDDHQERAVFTSDSKYYRYSNDELILDYNYQLGDTREVDGVKYYEITFVPAEGTTGIYEWSTEFWFTEQKILNIPGGDFIEEFERKK
ncbi:MAG: hypothetical protein JRJ57_01230 [Deltaproteobacteria bacterium]|nr:hypothetical protein [Deltaproteobacteria bacterium]